MYSAAIKASAIGNSERDSSLFDCVDTRAACFSAEPSCDVGFVIASFVCEPRLIPAFSVEIATKEVAPFGHVRSVDGGCFQRNRLRQHNRPPIRITTV